MAFSIVFQMYIWTGDTRSVWHGFKVIGIFFLFMHIFVMCYADSFKKRK